MWKLANNSDQNIELNPWKLAHSDQNRDLLVNSDQNRNLLVNNDQNRQLLVNSGQNRGPNHQSVWHSFP